ncbi:MAG: metal-binding protein [Cyanobacteria bacterium P01_E01_bin.34]
MPSGRTHDRITLYSLPLVTAAAGLVTRSSAVALAVSGAFLFAGLMFSGDLDTRSHQYNRWLWLRWIWLPYRRLCKHRSVWSHGPIVGTICRLLYVGGWALATSASALYAGHRYANWPWQPKVWLQQGLLWLVRPAGETGLAWWGVIAAMVVGLELGAMSHSSSDWIVSTFKRRVLRRRGAGGYGNGRNFKNSRNFKISQRRSEKRFRE